MTAFIEIGGFVYEWAGDALYKIAHGTLRTDKKGQTWFFNGPTNRWRKQKGADGGKAKKGKLATLAAEHGDIRSVKGVAHIYDKDSGWRELEHGESVKIGDTQHTYKNGRLATDEEHAKSDADVAKQKSRMDKRRAKSAPKKEAIAESSKILSPSELVSQVSDEIGFDTKWFDKQKLLSEIVAVTSQWANVTGIHDNPIALETLEREISRTVKDAFLGSIGTDNNWDSAFSSKIRDKVIAQSIARSSLESEAPPSATGTESEAGKDDIEDDDIEDIDWDKYHRDRQEKLESTEYGRQYLAIKAAFSKYENEASNRTVGGSIKRGAPWRLIEDRFRAGDPLLTSHDDPNVSKMSSFPKGLWRKVSKLSGVKSKEPDLKPKADERKPEVSQRHKFSTKPPKPAQDESSDDLPKVTIHHQRFSQLQNRKLNTMSKLPDGMSRAEARQEIKDFFEAVKGNKPGARKLLKQMMDNDGLSGDDAFAQLAEYNKSPDAFGLKPKSSEPDLKPKAAGGDKGTGDRYSIQPFRGKFRVVDNHDNGAVVKTHNTERGAKRVLNRMNAEHQQKTEAKQTMADNPGMSYEDAHSQAGGLKPKGETGVSQLKPKADLKPDTYLASIPDHKMIPIAEQTKFTLESVLPDDTSDVALQSLWDMIADVRAKEEVASNIDGKYDRVQWESRFDKPDRRMMTDSSGSGFIVTMQFMDNLRDEIERNDTKGMPLGTAKQAYELGKYKLKRMWNAASTEDKAAALKEMGTPDVAKRMGLDMGVSGAETPVSPPAEHPQAASYRDRFGTDDFDADLMDDLDF